MSNNLADFIERCILGKFLEAQEEQVLMRRNDLAVELSCAPSQISYVLNTRFTPERGFVVKSRRGAGGFVHIMRLVPLVKENIKSEQNVQAILQRLFNNKVISQRELSLLNFMLETAEDESRRFELLRQALRRMGDLV